MPTNNKSKPNDVNARAREWWLYNLGFTILAGRGNDAVPRYRTHPEGRWTY